MIMFSRRNESELQCARVRVTAGGSTNVVYRWVLCSFISGGGDDDDDDENNCFPMRYRYVLKQYLLVMSEQAAEIGPSSRSAGAARGVLFCPRMMQALFPPGGVD